jgi:hypothetical protein
MAVKIVNSKVHSSIDNSVTIPRDNILTQQVKMMSIQYTKTNTFLESTQTFP